MSRPARKWEEANKEWIQRVCGEPSTRVDVVNLEEELDKKLLQTRAMETGICPLRRQLYTECFGKDSMRTLHLVVFQFYIYFCHSLDELIRQVSLICVERGLMLLRVRDEIQMTIAAYQAFYESSMVFGMRKALHDEQDKVALKDRVRMENYKTQKAKHIQLLD